MEDISVLRILDEKISQLLANYKKQQEELGMLQQEIVALQAQNSLKDQEIQKLNDENMKKDIEIENIVNKIEALLS